MRHSPSAPRLEKSVTTKKLDTGPLWWGIASSAFQNEDRGEKPGSPNSFSTDWDLFAGAKRVPPKGDEAVSSWTHFDRDLEALKKIGVNHYRFGVEWARIEPQPGRYNEAALRRYVDMARQLKAAGIEPIVTLWHFTFPSWMVDSKKSNRSRWLSPLYRERWPLFVEKVTKAMAPYVQVFAPQNEPNGDLALGYISATWPPGHLFDFVGHSAALEESVWGFRKAAEIVRKNRKDALILSIAAMPYWERATRSDGCLLQSHAADQLHPSRPNVRCV